MPVLVLLGGAMSLAHQAGPSGLCLLPWLLAVSFLGLSAVNVSNNEVIASEPPLLEGSQLPAQILSEQY